MLIPLRPKELERLIPSVATSNQFQAALGNPRKILQRIIISSIGGVVTFLISQSLDRTQFYSLWLILAVVFLLYILWGPILEASRINSKLRSYPFAALFDGEVIDIFTQERVENSHEQANKLGELELIENRRRWLILEIGDEDGYLTKIDFPLDNKHQSIQNGSQIRCIVFSNNREFTSINNISDAWLPRNRLWVGEYPFLLKPAFEELCFLRLRN
ncbi:MULTISPECIES: hypothetical protein [Prochlorococcus]|uniref:Uncharacterized membrane protein n=1 Tax=Prochlorococcus marinus (strain SARG / CCMP1375 / SS120) TaxID=167539 RepID=Q7VC37_PROMA|nr:MULTISPECIES: hypothetical protein [Prochlorococcus]AAP99949.1 Uncharacterized membrane protein [Prochlorococcus marinus subsp. marinus str. CCMP1375]KGG11706.1 hypothetical protein EV04_0730 [Prochlorococcus marinus str. LG]KGG18881.1 hypothetical protein EV08_1368 [Prochlorococcus marinus str. SS2]KGG23581.1 hypothetical protein EV09_1205 [Prochlorococcus marinus str. SS35]KGG32183.1 hypothetical protein EV10_1298 [Prochlorococcus marinus str. SS51]